MTKETDERNNPSELVVSDNFRTLALTFAPPYIRAIATKLEEEEEKELN